MWDAEVGSEESIFINQSDIIRLSTWPFSLISFEHGQTDENTLSKFPILYKSNNLSIEMMYNVTPSTFPKRSFMSDCFQTSVPFTKFERMYQTKKRLVICNHHVILGNLKTYTLFILLFQNH